MAPDFSIAERFLPRLARATDPVTDSALTLAEEGRLKVAYSPFDHVAATARLAVVGITPGRTQTVNAIAAARQKLALGRSVAEVLRAAKLTGSFSGPMRSNLVAMLDAIGVNTLFGMLSTHVLFTGSGDEVHFTSALRYPVFVDGKNYNGTPPMLGSPLLRRMVETHLAEEARLLPDALWLPLGPKALDAVTHLVDMGLLDRRRVLAGLPHPSGANAERVAVFVGRKDPARASRQTDPQRLLAARATLQDQIAALDGMAA